MKLFVFFLIFIYKIQKQMKINSDLQDRKLQDEKPESNMLYNVPCHYRTNLGCLGSTQYMGVYIYLTYLMRCRIDVLLLILKVKVFLFLFFFLFFWLLCLWFQSFGNCCS